MNCKDRYFTVHGARIGPEGESTLSQRWRQRSLDLDDRTYSDAEREHALAPVDSDNRWSEPDWPDHFNSLAENED